jgi:hypothetical protein
MSSDQVHDVCFWMNGDAITEKGLLDMDIAEYKGSLSLKSCIMTSFYECVRAGINSTLTCEKCHFSDSKSHCIYSVNPRALSLQTSSISKTKKNGVFIDFLSESSDKEIIRKIDISSNDIYMNEGSGIEISSESFSAHNSSMELRGNKIRNNKRHGLLLSCLALTSLKIMSCEITHNVGSCLLM